MTKEQKVFFGRLKVSPEEGGDEYTNLRKINSYRPLMC